MQELLQVKAEAYDLVRQNKALNQYCAILEKALRKSAKAKDSMSMQEVLDKVNKASPPTKDI